MKKIFCLFFLISCFLFISCQKRELNERYYDDKLHHWVEVIDSCEYIVNLGHKGNCKFYKERRQKELQDLKEEILKELKNEK